ncbi:MAG: dethiobiotin synthase [Pseudohongiella sp.]|nr:dethiobiotin synthase [Pseudohongiella sp.]MDO9521939.1 dethiobiotin synthase [Pseudohongiella sp.]MDP2128574.1 dethiobiotin synthase [Pseudohongiella sp.]
MSDKEIANITSEVPPPRRVAVFVAGTDTGVGKSLVAATLLAAARSGGRSTAAMKPVASGCEEINGELRNEDALLLQRYCTLDLTYEQINPVALRAAVAPHLAAQMEGRQISLQRLVGFARAIFTERADFTVVEGAGGWRVPLNGREYLSGMPQALQLPVVLVVGIRLGCINHAVLSAEAIESDGLRLIGWVANHLSADMPLAAENIQTLKQLLPAPCLGELPWQPGAAPESFVSCLVMDHLWANS